VPFPVPKIPKVNSQSPHTSPRVGGEEMGRTSSAGSAGMVVEGKIIEFGSAGKVQVNEARERAEVGRRRIDKEESGRKGRDPGLGISGLK
jgi:hypothetical protein